MRTTGAESMPTPRVFLSSIVILVGALTATAAGLASAQDGGVRATLLGELSERYQPEVAVSGSVIVGVMGAAAVTDLAGDRLTVRAPADLENRRVCLRVTSRDGVYSSENRYELPATGLPGDVALPYASQHEKVIRSFSGTEVAMTASAGECDDAEAGYLVVGAPKSTGDVTIFVNSFEATDVYWSIDSPKTEGEGTDEANDCQEITEGRRTTFDFHCRVPRPADLDPFTVRIERERFGRPQPEVAVRILGTSE
jgi:hypothetical protein